MKKITIDSDRFLNALDGLDAIIEEVHQAELSLAKIDPNSVLVNYFKNLEKSLDLLYMNLMYTATNSAEDQNSSKELLPDKEDLN